MSKERVITWLKIISILTNDFSWVNEFEISRKDAQALLSEARELFELILVFLKQFVHQIKFVSPSQHLRIQVNHFIQKLIDPSAVIIIYDTILVKITGIVNLLRLLTLLIDLGLAIHLIEPVVFHNYYLVSSKMRWQINRSVLTLLPYCGIIMDNVFILKILSLILINNDTTFIFPHWVYAIRSHPCSYGWLPRPHLLCASNNICILT